MEQPGSEAPPPGGEAEASGVGSGAAPPFSAIKASAPVAQETGADVRAFDEQRVLFDQEIRTEVHRVIKYTLRGGAVLIGLILVVRILHVVTPDAWRWLADTDLQTIDKMLFSSAFGGFVLSYLKDSVVKAHSRKEP